MKSPHTTAREMIEQALAEKGLKIQDFDDLIAKLTFAMNDRFYLGLRLGKPLSPNEVLPNTRFATIPNYCHRDPGEDYQILVQGIDTNGQVEGKLIRVEGGKDVRGQFLRMPLSDFLLIARPLPQTQPTDNEGGGAGPRRGVCDRPGDKRPST